MTGGQNYDTMDNTPAPREAARGMGGGAWLVLLVALAVAGVWGARRSSGPGAAYAAGPGKPVMLMFTADWCGPCQAMKATVLSHPAVLDRLERKCRFRTVDLTVWEGPSAATAKHYGVEGVPTLIFVDADGREVSRYDGARDYQHFARWIDQNAK
jgi:thiol-disulfide isomerase/thioredoxin